jgi:hypothetical protein
MILNFSDFKAFVISLINAIITKLNADAAALQIKLDQVSTDLSAANATIVELQAAIAAGEAAKVEALAAQAAEQVAALDTFSTELAAQFNPTPATDAVAEIVTQEPDIVTPDVVADSGEVGTGEPTPEEVTEAVVEAIADATEEIPAAE